MVESNLPLGFSGVSSGYATISTNSAADISVSLPLELVFERVQTRGGADNYIAHTFPIDIQPRLLDVLGGCCNCATNEFGFLWNCANGCLCDGFWHSLCAYAEWEGYGCLFDVEVSCPCQFYKRETPQSWMSLSAPSVVFVNATNHVSTLSVSFEPPDSTNGVVTLRCKSGDGKFALRSQNGDVVTLPRQWNAEMFSGETYTVEGVAASDFVGDVCFRMEYNSQESGVYGIEQTMTVSRVACVNMTSIVAGDSGNPPPFAGETACPFSITNSVNPDRHLVVPFCNVVETNENFSVVDFAVDMTIELTPSGTPTNGVTAVWTVLDGTPRSGELLPECGLSASYRNPKVGGIYRFAVTCNGSPATECNLVLPLAGGSIDAICENDISLADVVIRRINATTGSLERQSPFFGLDWFNNNGMGDYLGRVDSSTNPTVWRYNQVNDDTGMGAVATWYGIPVRMAKASNFMVGYATARLGVWRVSRGLSQFIGTGNDTSARMSWDAGVDVAHGTNFSDAVGCFVTNSWSVSDVKEKKLWPNTAESDNHVLRNVCTNFNYQFISPGFIERGITE